MSTVHSDQILINVHILSTIHSHEIHTNVHIIRTIAFETQSNSRRLKATQSDSKRLKATQKQLNATQSDSNTLSRGQGLQKDFESCFFCICADL